MNYELLKGFHLTRFSVFPAILTTIEFILTVTMVEAFEQFNGPETLIIFRTSYNSGQQSIPETA